MSSFHFLLHFTIFLLLFHQNSSFPSKQQLFLPLKTTLGHHHLHAFPRNSKLSSSAVATATTNKLAFHHNVTLTVSLSVGSPPQNVTMVLDTGSELSWLHCKKTPNLNSIFIPQISKSYKAIPCASPVCNTRTRDLPVPALCDPNSKLCHVAVSYADASSIEGNLAYENFVIGSLTRPGLLFGCMDSGYSSNSEEDSKTTGLMGMNRGSLSFVSQMGFPKFSYCISGFDSSGVLLLGDARFSWLKELNYTPLIQISDPLPYFDRVAYTIQPEGIKVGNKLLGLPRSAFLPDHTGAGQTMVDSGTQFTFLLGPVYTALRNEFLQQTRGVLRVYEDPNFVFQGAMDLCYRVGVSSQASFSNLPRVSLIFQGAEMIVSGERLLYRVPGMNKGSDSVYCFTFGNSDLLGIEAFVIGHHHQQNVWMEFDLVKSRVGFAEVRCDLAGQRLGMGL
ncbi:aspartic proteinase PCS1-like [Durio zibethinus]|uniref:Aspartic proteinase PCS1-like n=1 Tax=Durio zibethinus TaxID=66656 RepID=A0A6P6AI40_DURZI|nr:aspartic proteinase PCS1-like [Durio zibethinus]